MGGEGESSKTNSNIDDALPAQSTTEIMLCSCGEQIASESSPFSSLANSWQNCWPS
jgi:hypothetical protein